MPQLSVIAAPPRPLPWLSAVLQLPAAPSALQIGCEADGSPLLSWQFHAGLVPQTLQLLLSADGRLLWAAVLDSDQRQVPLPAQLLLPGRRQQLELIGSYRWYGRMLQRRVSALLVMPAEAGGV